MVTKTVRLTRQELELLAKGAAIEVVVEVEETAVTKGQGAQLRALAFERAIVTPWDRQGLRL